MKKIIIFIAFLFVVLGTQAQKGSVITLTADTLKGADTTDYVIELRAPSYDLLTIDVVYTQVGGTSDGTGTLYGSMDNTNWVFINGVGAGVLTASPKASITGADLNQITITNGLVASWVLKDVPWRYIMHRSIGTTSDTTAIAAKYRYK
jgi:hypothetical protein